MKTKRTVLITGCSDGSLGSVLAHRFHTAGWRVFASARSLSKLESAEVSGIETIQLDTLSSDSIESCVSRLQELTGGSLDVLVNNAGGGYSMPLLDIDFDKARALFDLNVWAPISVTRAFLPLLMKSAYGGMVVNNTSCSSLTAGAMPFAGVYTASKAAMTNLTEVLRLELEPFNIRVINLMTGAVRSTFHSNAPADPLPVDSLYNVAKEIVERTMAGSDVKNKADPEIWAIRVVQSLSKNSPPYWVWSGTYSTVIRLASLLPIGILDRAMKKSVGLNVVEEKLKSRANVNV